MAWTTPRTWTAAEIVTADMMNTYVRDNQNYVYERLNGTAKQYVRTATNYTTTSTSLTAVDGTNMALSLTTDGSDVLITFCGYVSISSGTVDISFAILVDATTYTVAITQAQGTTGYRNIAFSFPLTGLSAAAHTFTLLWSTASGTLTMYAGSTTFDVREMIGVVA